jgi:ABC-type multidrug transport system permease subunit
MCALYFLIIFGLVLRLNIAIFPLIAVILLQAFMITGIQSLISGFCRTEKTSNMVSIFVLMGFMFLGGGAMPIDSYGDVSALTNFAPNYHVLKLYETIVLDTPMSSMMWRVGIVLAISFVLALVGMLVFVKKEERTVP